MSSFLLAGLHSECSELLQHPNEDDEQKRNAQNNLMKRHLLYVFRFSWFGRGPRHFGNSTLQKSVDRSRVFTRLNLCVFASIETCAKLSKKFQAFRKTIAMDEFSIRIYGFYRGKIRRLLGLLLFCLMLFRVVLWF